VNAGQPARQPFTYRVPQGMSVRPGQAVFVPFGTRVLQGVVLGAAVEAPDVEIKDIDAVADERPLLDWAHSELTRWMSTKYLAPLWDCVATCLPSGFGQKPVTMVSPVDIPPLYPVNPVERRILRHLGEHGRTPLDVLREAVGTVTNKKLQEMQQRGLLTVTQGLARPRGRARFERRLRLVREPDAARTHVEMLREKSPRSVDARLLALLANKQEITLREARSAGATARHADRLEEEGWLEETAIQVERDPIAGYTFAMKPPVVLSPEQQEAVERIWTEGGVHLLHGVTGSGKTEVYMELARRTLAEEWGVLVLVPEISLTPQAIRRYGEQFGNSIAVIHSGLGGGELYDQWFRIKDGRARLVLGSRSAVFAPIDRLGLIVVDEEHEPSYKQTDPQPRYHARAAAEQLASLTSARLVLGTATPDLVTFHRSERGEIGRIALEQRLAPTADGGFQEAVMPRIEVVDMRNELREGNRAVFSRVLVRAVSSALRRGEQAILFLNRRGSARFVLCRDCGAVAECPTCGVAMSMQGDDGALPKMVCHHCGRTRKPDLACPRCGGTRYRPFGVGTQRIEMEARRAFPRARVARWDSQSASRKGAHEDLVRRLESGDIDIVVGTQVLAKGLDLPGLTVVGVVDADVGLHLPTYLAPERTHQLLSQVIGRAGRREREGIAIIQTYSPEAPAIEAAAYGDYRSFFDTEIAHRRRAGYPPFTRLVRLTYRHKNEEHGLEEASRVATELRTNRDIAGRADPEVLGPSPAYVRRLRGEYRWQLLLRGHDPAALVDRVRLGPRWTVDVDPVNLL
jgi:primosomal protein N' (replication factor Y) (superfamily II helicase)